MAVAPYGQNIIRAEDPMGVYAAPGLPSQLGLGTESLLREDSRLVALVLTSIRQGALDSLTTKDAGSERSSN